MPFNGSGTFNRIYSWVTDAANGIFVSSTRTDTDTNDIAAGLSNCVTRDGQSPPTANIPMGGFKFTGLGAGSAATDSFSVANANSSVNEFRLTLSSGVPVADVTNATTIYCCPYVGNHIALYDGSLWHMRTSAEFSLALGTLTANRPYDIFCYDNSGVPTLEFLIWTSATVRATALAYQNGVLVKSGDATRRYLGTFAPNSTTQVSDNRLGRNIWNYYNRVTRLMNAQEVASWPYTLATIRQANGNTANQLNLVVGVDEDVVHADIVMAARNSSANVGIAVGVGLDSTTTFANSATALNIMPRFVTQVVNINTPVIASFCGRVGVGKHALMWNEYSAATGATTWDPVSVTTSDFGGIQGSVLA